MQLFAVTAESLASIEAFKVLGHTERLELAASCSGRRYATGEQVVNRNSVGDDVYFLLSGRVGARIYATNGRVVAFTELRPGAAFGDISALDGLPRSADVDTKEESVVVVMHKADFMQAIRKHPNVMAVVMQHLAGLVRQLMDRIVELSTLAVRNRIHAELLRRAREYTDDDMTAEIVPAPTHAELATHVSTNRPSVTRELRELECAGLIQQQRSKFLRVLDLPRLERMVMQVKGE